MSNIVRSQQSGITLIGFLLVLIVVGIFAFIGIKLFPAYYEYYNVVSAMEQLAREPGSVRMSPAEILDALERRMYVNYVDERFVNKRSFQIKRNNMGYILSVKYERREPVVYNLDYVAKFERSVQIGTKSSDLN